MALPSSLLISLQILLFLSSTRTESFPDLTFCGDTNYTAGSAYESNLLSLINKLILSTWNSSFYSTATIGSSPDAQVFGLAQCRPDVSATTCNDCLNSTAIAAPKPNGGCPLSKSAAFRSDYCVLRYSDQRFFSIPETRLRVSFTNPGNASNPDVFNRTINALMDKTSAIASEADSRFGAGNANYSDSRDIYGMAWCTQDLSTSDCHQCLDDMSVRLPVAKVGGRVMTASCIARFEISSFISISPPPPLEHSPSPPSTLAEPPHFAPPPIQSNDNFSGHGSNTAKRVLIISLPIAFALALVCVLLILRLKNKRVLERLPTGQLEYENIRPIDSLVFDLDTIRKATNDFSEENMLGAGGFGPVYKGLLEDGQHIAVKRLSRTSSQGFVEMKNEVALVVKLQHKNLARLLGFCLEHNEMLLVYEYLPNTSLDKYLFDPAKRPQLDWGIRYKIVQGIGRGLLYLHEDSLLKIIHRDLKASNILLDTKMTPKISDFGLARLFHIDQTQQNTSRIAGTFGYMAPEYAMHGLFSTKSDVFSYGVLILEIITGRRNDVFTDKGHDLDLLSYVWKNWNQGTALQVVDQYLGQEYQSQQVLRCLHIGLICVQDDPLLRPSMAEVMVMMSSDSTTIPAPLMPPFYVGDSSYGDFESSAREAEEIVSQRQPLRAVSGNAVTITNLESR